MSAVTFVEALDAVMARPGATPEARRCIASLDGAVTLQGPKACRSLPALARLRAELLVEYAGAVPTPGHLVIVILRAKSVQTIVSWVCLATGVKTCPIERAVRIHGDCYLALSEWTLRWNQRQMRLVGKAGNPSKGKVGNGEQAG